MRFTYILESHKRYSAQHAAMNLLRADNGMTYLHCNTDNTVVSVNKSQGDISWVYYTTGYTISNQNYNTDDMVE